MFEWFYKYAAPLVLTEIRKVREVEKKEKRRKLFPIRWGSNKGFPHGAPTQGKS